MPSAVLNAIVEMKLEDFCGSFLLLASSTYGAKPAAIALKVWSWPQMCLPFWKSSYNITVQDVKQGPV